MPVQGYPEEMRLSMKAEKWSRSPASHTGDTRGTMRDTPCVMSRRRSACDRGGAPVVGKGERGGRYAGLNLAPSSPPGREIISPSDNTRSGTFVGSMGRDALLVHDLLRSAYFSRCLRFVTPAADP